MRKSLKEMLPYHVEKEKLLGPDEPLVLEYRLNNQLTINHATTQINPSAPVR